MPEMGRTVKRADDTDLQKRAAGKSGSPFLMIVCNFTHPSEPDGLSTQDRD